MRVLILSFFSIIIFNVMNVQAFEKIRIYEDANLNVPIEETSSYETVQSLLSDIGVRFEKWETSHDLEKSNQELDIIKAYQADIDKLIEEKGYKSVDVVKMTPLSANREALRQKFLREHIHNEDEVRLFTEGSGLFYLHINNYLYIVLCEKGDLISIPAGCLHFFDMGEKPYFTAIRLFTNSDGWIPIFNESHTLQNFPKYE